MEFLFLLWFLIPVLAGWIASKKGRRWWLWAIISYCTIWGILVLIFLPSNKVKVENISLNEDT